MEEFFFSNRSEQILYDLLTNYIGKQSGHNITKYPQVRSILKNSIRNVYSIKNTYPEMRNTNLSDKERISFLQKKVLRRCLPTIISHIKQIDSRRNENSMIPRNRNRNNPLGKQLSNRNLDNTIIPSSMRQPSMPIQRPQIDDPTTFNRPVPPPVQRAPVSQVPPPVQRAPVSQVPPPVQRAPENRELSGERISMETRAQLDELIQLHEPESHNLDSGVQQQFSTLEDMQKPIMNQTNQPVEKDEPIQDLAKRSDELLREREEELKAFLQTKTVKSDVAENIVVNRVENIEFVYEKVNGQEVNGQEVNEKEVNGQEVNEKEVNNNIVSEQNLYNENRFKEFQKEMDEKFEREMRLKMNDFNSTLTDIRSQNVQLERERDTLQNNIKQLMNDNMKNNETTTSFKNELNEYKTKYNDLLESTNDKFQKLEEQYETSKDDLIQKYNQSKNEMQTDFNLKYKEYEIN